LPDLSAMSADEVELTVVDLLLPGTIQRAVTWMAALGRGRRKSLGAPVWWSTRKMRKSLGDAEAELDVGDGNMGTWQGGQSGNWSSGTCSPAPGLSLRRRVLAFRRRGLALCRRAERRRGRRRELRTCGAVRPPWGSSEASRLAWRSPREPSGGYRSSCGSAANCQGAADGGEDGDSEDLNLEFQFVGYG
jgi:hypothetical protein